MDQRIATTIAAMQESSSLQPGYTQAEQILPAILSMWNSRGCENCSALLPEKLLRLHWPHNGLTIFGGWVGGWVGGIRCVGKWL